MEKVLIVDDEQIVLEVLQRILTRLGYEVTVTESGATAMVWFSDNDYDLVLLDVLMPERNGFEIAKEMKAIRPEQKIIMVTGLGPHAAGYHAESQEVDVDEVLSKPFSYEKVKNLVASVMNGDTDLQENKLQATQ